MWSGYLLGFGCFEQTNRFRQAEKASVYINLIFSSVFGNGDHISNAVAASAKSPNNKIDIYHLQIPLIYRRMPIFDRAVYAESA